MTEEQAIDLVDAVRRSGSELMAGLRRLSDQNPDDLAEWRSAIADVMGQMQDQLLEPIFSKHPRARPKALGGVR